MDRDATPPEDLLVRHEWGRAPDLYGPRWLDSGYEVTSVDDGAAVREFARVLRPAGVNVFSYEPMLRRRLEAGNSAPSAAANVQRLLAPLVRGALELDTLFIGRRPGYFGPIAIARMPLSAR